MQTPETEGLRIPWKFKSLPKEKALAMTRALGANVGRYGSDVRSRYLNARRGIQTGHERHLFRNSYRDGKFLFKRRFGFRWSYPNIIRRRYSPNVSSNQGSAVVSGRHLSTFRQLKIPGCSTILSFKLSSILLKKRTEEIIETSPMLSDEFDDYMSSRMIF